MPAKVEGIQVHLKGLDKPSNMVAALLQAANARLHDCTLIAEQSAKPCLTQATEMSRLVTGTQPYSLEHKALICKWKFLSWQLTEKESIRLPCICLVLFPARCKGCSRHSALLGQQSR